jgi:dihydrofolate reductase
VIAMRISIIAAVSENGVIGREGRLPWHLSNDLRRFKQLTMGHTIIMGRRTWESIGRPLPGRRMIVVSRQPSYHVEVNGVEVATSLDDALNRAEVVGEDEAFVIGGAELYQQAMQRADRLYYTLVRANEVGDTYFPHVDWTGWQLIESHDNIADFKNEYAHTFYVYQRLT